MATPAARRAAERPIARSPAMAKSQKQQNSPAKRPESSDEDENNNRHRASMVASAQRLLHKTTKRSSHSSSSSSLNLRLSNRQQQQQPHKLPSTLSATQSASVESPSAPKVIGASVRQTSAVRQPGATVKRASKSSIDEQPAQRKPLAQVNGVRWKSSTSALNSRAGQQVASKGQWCCELPHHTTAAHTNTRRQSNLTPHLNRAICQQLNGLRNKRTASSLSLVAGDRSTRCSQPSTTISSEQNGSDSSRRAPRQQTTTQTICNEQQDQTTAPSSKQRPQASSQVTNSRLRQGALFARRQLHLLPATSQTSAGPTPRLQSSRQLSSSSSTRSARVQGVASAQCGAGRKVEASVAAPKHSPVSKPSTASEARRRATRQLFVVAAPRSASNDDSAATKPLKLVEKKADHLTSSSSSLSLSAFVVKRPRQQQHSSTTSSSCSSISTASRRCSSDSSGAAASDSHSLSQSCTQLSASNQSEWPTSRDEQHVTATCQLIGSNKSASEQFGERAASEQQATASPADKRHECDQRTRFHIASNDPELNHKTQDTDHNQSDNLLGSTHLSNISSDIETHIAHSSAAASDKSQAYKQTPLTRTACDSTNASEHVFSVRSDDQQSKISQQQQQVNPQATIKSSSLEDADIVAIGCSPVASVVETPLLALAPSTENNNKFSASSETSHQESALHDTMATASCNTNEYQLIVTSNNHENDLSNSQRESGPERNVDMQISLGSDGDDYTAKGVENIDTSIDINEQQEVVSMDQAGPMDAPGKPAFGMNAAVSQELAQSPIIGVKTHQPLGLHQSMNIAANNSEHLPIATRQQEDTAEEHFCASDLPVALEGQAAPQPDLTPAASACEPLNASENVIAEQQRMAMAEIPISLEPISDFYDLESRPFARGKFAQVKRCVRKSPSDSMIVGETYAAKCVKKRHRLVDIKHEILLEIEALKLSYRTDHIVRLYEVYETQNEMVLVLEMAKGGELQRVLDDEDQIEESLVRKMIDQILDGLIHLHDNNIAHLDIKPQNLLLTKPFPDGDIKLCDFGISRRITRDCEIREICGTPDYVAPEILHYDPISLATDMWSLGVLTYVLLSGYSPFGSDNKQQTFCNITLATLDFPQEIFANISSEAIDFVSNLIVREPAERLTSRQAKQHHWISGKQQQND